MTSWAKLGLVLMTAMIAVILVCPSVSPGSMFSRTIADMQMALSCAASILLLLIPLILRIMHAALEPTEALAITTSERLSILRERIC